MSKRYEVDQRNALFSSFNSKAKNERDASREHYAANSAVMAEAENDQRIIDLEAKVHDLRDIGLRLREETQESNSVLSFMSTDFDSVGNLVGNAMKRLQNLSHGRTGRHLWYMMLFAFALLVLMYLVYGRFKK